MKRHFITLRFLITILVTLCYFSVNAQNNATWNQTINWINNKLGEQNGTTWPNGEQNDEFWEESEDELNFFNIKTSGEFTYVKYSVTSQYGFTIKGNFNDIKSFYYGGSFITLEMKGEDLKLERWWNGKTNILKEQKKTQVMLSFKSQEISKRVYKAFNHLKYLKKQDNNLF